MAEKIRKRIFLSGRVQGVGFRAYLRRKARMLNLSGWAKNLIDGRVEAVFVGAEDRVREMLELAKKGPRMGKVEEMEVIDEEHQDEFSDFSIRY
ncbi:acylphosphatase [Fuchsiella alkaliacetigena]|uniref:acylphosphatase n=1 Tax=Fuchsiella alkaliacetigena TaxID=957042 RepID=UPI002009DEB2|nr:acylphosphatase [Fuchsiella alkaliacetigena]MCK8825801.1 acylphosphatase [Fuchsiella alkaliacetigena]